MDDELSPFVDAVMKNRSTINIVSIVLLLIAAWSCLEIITNVSGSDLIPPETGTVKDASDPDGQRINDGKVLFIGGVFGTLGVVFQLMIFGLPPEEEDVVVTVEEVDEDIEEVVEEDSQPSEDAEEPESPEAVPEEVVSEPEPQSEPLKEEETQESESTPVDEQPKEEEAAGAPKGRKF